MYRKFKEVANTTDVVVFKDSVRKKLNRKTKSVINKTNAFASNHQKELASVMLILITTLVLRKSIK